jgi:hypothetical protein
MEPDIKELFAKGGVIAVLLFAGLWWLPAIRENAGDPSASVDVIGDGVVILIYSVLPASELAIFVDITVAFIAAIVSVDKLNARAKGIVVAAGAAWVISNMIMTAIFPPV